MTVCMLESISILLLGRYNETDLHYLDGLDACGQVIYRQDVRKYQKQQLATHNDNSV
jgi:hypothetical protein